MKAMRDNKGTISLPQKSSIYFLLNLNLIFNEISVILKYLQVISLPSGYTTFETSRLFSYELSSKITRISNENITPYLANFLF